MSGAPPFHPGSEATGILAALVESSDDAIYAKDLQNRILSWNAGAEALYGYTKAEIIGRSVEVLAFPEHLDEIARILERVRSGESVKHHETVRRTKAGRPIHVSLTVSPIYGEGRTIVGASVIARDITSQRHADRQIRDSEARLRSLIESAVDGIIVIDAYGCIESFNRAAERLFGYTADEVVSRNVNVLMPSPFHEEHDTYISRYLETGVAKIIGVGREVIGLRKDGTTFPIHLAVGEMSIGGERKFTGIIHDLSARVRMEAQIREQSALVRLGEMAAVIAHEVKNPLAAVRGAIQVIGKRLPAGSREAGVIADIIARIDALNQLVKDMLIFARPPQPHPQAVDVSQIATATAALVHQDAAYHDVGIAVDGGAPPAVVDPELLRIVFLNLLINSAQAMRGTGRIAITVSAEDGWCRAVVADTGPGIPPDVREKLFTPFFTTKSRGTGLGLATVKRLVEAQGGSVTVDCPESGGTLVTLRLPLASG
jgi:two-component system, LuxR family, sensor kinase FixL